MLFLIGRLGLETVLLYSFILVFSICCHEYMHARAALWQGDDTAALLGHLTLNPLKQMGWTSLIMMLLVGLAFGSVPVNRARLRRPYGEAVVSFAGPFANMILFFLFSVGLSMAYIHKNEPLMQLCMTGGVLNCVLFLLNMVPCPPFDGYGILVSFFPEWRNTSSEFINGATFMVIMVLFMSVNFLYEAGEFLTLFTASKIASLLYPLVSPG
jgi:Zn-dependent protease